eukprot:5424153-Amphidinium_carterae.1
MGGAAQAMRIPAKHSPTQPLLTLMSCTWVGEVRASPHQVLRHRFHAAAPVHVPPPQAADVTSGHQLNVNVKYVVVQLVEMVCTHGTEERP